MRRKKRLIKNYYKKIPSEEMTDFEEFYRRIAKQLPNDCRIAEIGCSDGRSAILLAEVLTSMKKKFDLKMIDSMDYGKSIQRNTIISHLVKSGMGRHIELLEMDSLSASCRYPDGYFHFVFIDSSHQYEPTKAEIRLWYRKVMDECILAGHDYFGIEDVRNAVNEVVPAEILKTEETARGMGVWWFKKTNNLILK